ncbi:hypothetical protein B0J11DRAFT_607999 [Dendryphion nanum]|uniref:Uncharacterized protein n=1 Tax=Dendryphion nanum TaxID=256645 RepID=A0A9P9DNQ8_9PLEO|nr:hypothetical protein B0J11DRAFT_607999 [Dendryphion nanum]
MPQHWSIKGSVTRSAEPQGKIQLFGNPIRVPSTQSRNSGFDNTESVHRQAPQPAQLFFTELLTEASKGDSGTMPGAIASPDDVKRAKTLRSTIENPSSQTIDTYNPLNPLIFTLDPTILARINASTTDRSIQGTTQSPENNPFLLDHMLANAPYTQKYCRRCTSDRKCRGHRPTLQLQTSVSLCAHMRLNLFWNVDDMLNRKCSWQLEIKSYLNRDIVFTREHESCKAFTPRERVKVLVQRLIEDFEAEGRRGVNARGVEREVFALLGAWEAAKVRVLTRREEGEKKVEKRREVAPEKKIEREKKGRVMEREAKMLKKAQQEKESLQQEVTKKRKLSAVEKASENVERECKKVCVEITTILEPLPKPRVVATEHHLLSTPLFSLPQDNSVVKNAKQQSIAVVGSTPELETPKPGQKSDLTPAALQSIEQKNKTDIESTLQPEILAHGSQVIPTPPTSPPRDVKPKDDDSTMCSRNLSMTSNFSVYSAFPIPMTSTKKRKCCSVLPSLSTQKPSKRVRFSEEIEGQEIEVRRYCGFDGYRRGPEGDQSKMRSTMKMENWSRHWTMGDVLLFGPIS